MSQGVILSHTKKASGFCTCLAVSTLTSVAQIRPLLGSGMPLTAESVGLTEEQLLAQWIPGRIVTFESVKDQPLARPTHPEDRLIKPGTLKLTSHLDQRFYNGAVQQLTYEGLRKLYPGLQMDNGKGYVGAQRLLTSVGYVRCPTVTLYPGDQRVTITDAIGQRLSVKVTDAHLLARFAANEFRYGQDLTNRLVRLSLAHPWDKFQPPRCYLMMSHLDI